MAKINFKPVASLLVIARQLSKPIALTLGLIAFSFLFVWYVFAQWQEPTAVPPGDNVPAPLNVGPFGQSKEAGLILNTGGAATGLIVDQGNVGIGTTSPGTKLNVFGGDVKIERYDAPLTVSLLSDGLGTILELEGEGSGNSWQIKATSGGNINFTKANSGNIPFSVADNAPSNALRITGDGDITMNVPSSSTGSMKLEMGIGIAPTVLLTDRSALWVADRGGVAGKASFHIMAEDGTQHVLGDLVGIGTTSPSQKLDVVGGYARSDTGFCIDADCITSWPAGGGGYWTQSGTDLYPNNTSWNVGIGTTNPTNKLTFFSAASEDVIRFNGPFDAYATLGHNFGGGLARISLTSQDDVFGLSSFVAVDPYEYARLVQCDPSGSMSWEVSSDETVAWLSTTGMCGGGSPMFRIYSGADGGNRRVSIGPFRAPSDKSFYVWGGDVAFERNDAPNKFSVLSNGWGAIIELEGQGGGDSWEIQAPNSGDLQFVDNSTGNEPFEIFAGAMDNLMNLTTDHIQLFGTAGSVGSRTLTIGDGVAPGAFTIADAVTMWVADRGGVAGKAALHIQTEDNTKHVFGDLVGIGTTSPTPGNKLHVAGNVKFNGYVTGDGVSEIGDSTDAIKLGTGLGGWDVYINDDIYVIDKLSALSITDRTAYPKDLETAYKAVMSMVRLPDGEFDENDKEKQLDHTKLHEFIKSEDGEGRNLSATVSAQNEVIKDLLKRIERLEARMKSEN